MPPRMKVVVNRGRGGSSGGNRGRRRQRGEGSSRPPPPPRKILRPRAVDFEEVDEVVSEVCALFTTQGWIPFMSNHRRFYPSLVQEFYGNLSKIDDESYYTIVGGIDIILNEELISDALDIPLGGAVYKHYAFSISDLLTDLLGCDYNERCGAFVKLNANKFPAIHRITHHMLTTIVIPKGGSRDEVTEMHKFMLYCLLRTIQIDLPYLMFKLMISIPTHPNRSLPYAAALTEIFDYCGVDLNGHFYEDILPTEVYNRHKIMVAMKYTMDELEADFMPSPDEGCAQGLDAPEHAAPEGHEPERQFEEEPRAQTPVQEGSPEWWSGKFDALDQRVTNLQDSLGSLSLQVDQHHQQYLGHQQRYDQNQQNILDSLQTLNQNVSNQNQLYQNLWDHLTGHPPGPSQ